MVNLFVKSLPLDCSCCKFGQCRGKMHIVMKAVTNSNRPIVTNGKKYPPNVYREPPTIGPTIKPSPKNVSREANVMLTLSGNSFAMIANDAVKNAALPNASMIRMIKANVINSVCP